MKVGTPIGRIRDSGAPPDLKWTVPEGVSLSEISWPWPSRIPYGPLMNFGYHDAVSLPMTVSVDEGFSGQSLSISAVGRILVCADICIPEKVELSLELPIGQSTELDASAAHAFGKSDAGQPVAIFPESAITLDNETLTLDLAWPLPVNHRVESIEYFPNLPDQIDNAAEQAFRLDENGLRLTLRAGYALRGLGITAADADLSGVIVFHERAGATLAFEKLTGEADTVETLTSAIAFTTGEATVFPAKNESGGSPVKTQDSIGFLLAILFAFLGGLILNLMPCVFPVLSIKVLSLMEGVHGDARQLATHGWVYTLGVALSFVGVALVLIVLRAGGEQIGWGFQLQSPLVVGLLVYVFALVGLNLAGYFEVGTRLMSFGDSAVTSGVAGTATGADGGDGADRSGVTPYTNSFMIGVLATIVAAPCTAPFMGAAVGYALLQHPLTGLMVFASLGAGLAAPFLILCHQPKLMSRLPRPGAWMVTLRQLFAFPMWAAALWLLWVLGQQAGVNGMSAVLGGLLLIVLAIWLLTRSASKQVRWVYRIVAGVLLLSAVYITQLTVTPGPAATESQSSNQSLKQLSKGSQKAFQEYSQSALEQALQEGPVFVNFTAAWCITCKVNELNALNSQAFNNLLAQKGVTYLKGDWTNEDPEITRALAVYGRSGVPLYLVYPKGAGPGSAEVLPQILTENAVIRALEKL